MRTLLILLALIGPVLPTPAPMMTFEHFTAHYRPQRPGSAAPARAYATWEGTGGAWSLCVNEVCTTQRWRSGFNKAALDARPGDIVSLRDGARVLASDRVALRLWVPLVR